MKKYVILTPAIGGMGGSQMYCYNKCLYLKDRGWEVCLIYFQNFEIIIEDLKQINSTYIPDLSYGIHYVTPQQRRNVIKKIKTYIGNFDECVVETQMVKLAMWGELIAEQLHSCHILNPIEEELHSLTDGYVNFMEFKLRRGELLNASEEALKRFFRSKYKAEFQNFFFTMVPYCSNVTSNNTLVPINYTNADYTILSIGRLDKPYIVPMANEICKFARYYPDKRVNVIFIGASTTGLVEKQLVSIFSSSNCSLFLEGYRFPVPIQILDKADVAIACANSVLVSANCGVPTIVIDAFDYDAVGIYGYTTMQKLERCNEERIKVSKLLKDVLIDSKYKKAKVLNNDEIEARNNLNQQIDFAEKALNKEHKYYNVSKVYTLIDYIYCNLKRIGHIILKR